ncbi:DNA starvation/stationary phase protection protein [Ornithobacterium rhinotracheale]|uniref:Dps family protein n=1 Tax=Ornithobacterium rhinotracheale TaxID=28251 RepID=UPI00129CEDCB|nr:Dps family protein [Ornithobacterium rhinotracheale]MRI63349.1 DNA starvation/stationary phase protection protein [Ornithobacterium rhinotracheale]MRJ08907.1 DNA starvation/stationary phase protection protein [Ornithobacterium rhinotracheale]UOH78806.1 DNA starvation/stationary phase protection protein [Ornithobacterium rhinotracheale]
MSLTTIGLDKKKSEKLCESLNKLLANFQVYYQNLRSVHWNVKGHNFFALHEKFEELYNEAQLQIDEIAERVLTLGETPMHTFQDYLDNSQVKPAKNVKQDTEAVKVVLDSMKELLIIEREILEESGELEDEGTNAMMSDFISGQEKTAWMLNSWLNREI